jgi:F-type H+-transporting ATPase subunit a
LTYNNGTEHVAFLRSFTTDLNSTLAMAVLSLTIVQIYAFQELGLGGRFRFYFTEKWYKPGKIFIGLNEIFSELLRLVTLSLRLFGVIYGGEALLNAILQLAGNFAWAALVPIMFLEIFFSIVQAYLFMMLTSTYLVMSVSHGEEHEASSSKTAEANA